MLLKESYKYLFAFIFVMQLFLLAKPPEDIQKLPNGVSIHQLDNGIKVLLIENPALPMIGVNTVVKVGSAYETFTSSGMSHMLEHLLFNGTSELDQRALYDLTDRIGGYNNANTSEYYTNYMMVTPSENIGEGMKIQAGMLFDSILPETNFEKEKGIVLEEIAKSLAKPQEQADRNVRDILFTGHALSLPTLGTYETIKNMKRDDVYKFYKNNYVPNNMLMSVIGNFKTSEMLKLLADIYGKAEPGNVERPNLLEWGTGFEPQKLKTTEMVNYRFYKGEKTLLQHFYAVDNYSSDFYDLLDFSLDKQKDKIKSSLEEKYPDQIKSIDFKIRHYPIASYLEATVILEKSENISGISNDFNNELWKLSLTLPDDVVKAEAVKAKSAFLKQIEKPHMFGIYNADLIAQNGLGVIIEEFSGEGIIEAGNTLKEFKISGEPKIIIQYPSSSSDTEEAAQIKVELFENGDHNATVIAKQNSASNLLAIHYMFKYKSKYEAKYRNDVAKKWHNAFGNRMKSAANQEKSAKYGLSFVVNDIPFIPMDDIYLSPTFGYIRVEGLADDIEGVIKYLNEEMLNFVPTEEEFNKVNKGGMHSMMMGKDKSKEMFKQAYESLVMEPEVQTMDVKVLDYNKFLEFGKEYFVPSNIIISVVSKADPKTINEYFADFKLDVTPVFTGLAKERGFKMWNEPKKLEKEGGGEQSHTFYGFVKKYDKIDKPALTVLSLMLKDDIVFNIREKQGLAYRMSAGINMRGDKALFYVKVPTQPKNVEKLVPQFPGLFNPNFADKITEDDLEKTVNMYLGKMMFRRLSSINQAYYLAHSYYFDGNIEADKNDLDALKNVKLDDVKNAAKKYLKVENPVEIIIH
ncbi:FIG007959: peptidase, M16 family [hydrothermal vent metagenome]|uniref:FIG007959: peptidase, M16 family n=1 Tax=hydrothermal vent metagenome TaxID=652676 RepID=A0A3B1CT89_9ZZZZ